MKKLKPSDDKPNEFKMYMGLGLGIYGLQLYEAFTAPTYSYLKNQVSVTKAKEALGNLEDTAKPEIELTVSRYLETFEQR